MKLMATENAALGSHSLLCRLGELLELESFYSVKNYLEIMPMSRDVWGDSQPRIHKLST
jgi:hypothetical protein